MHYPAVIITIIIIIISFALCTYMQPSWIDNKLLMRRVIIHLADLDNEMNANVLQLLQEIRLNMTHELLTSVLEQRSGRQ